MLARHGRRLLNLVDDTPVVPGDNRPAFQHVHQARQILNDAEEDLRDWVPNLEPITSNANDMSVNLVPGTDTTIGASVIGQDDVASDNPEHSGIAGGGKGRLESTESRDFSGSSTVVQPEHPMGFQQRS